MTQCPACGHDVWMAHDTFEDMYRCPRKECWTFIYPEEIGLLTDLNAPVFRPGVKSC